MEFLSLLGLMFIFAKIVGWIDWKWKWVLAPLWVPTVTIGLGLLVIYMCLPQG